ncbi:uncharacterized protein si:ch211-214j24.10 isoform X1 [Osmerus eperlanus]|uniref:uncharacterized protein si:ch211-214j24.10 isoform X1 n=1 Tax=Osmerus eperlanus TaxID=29151 RepID=UPI002E133D46
MNPTFTALQPRISSDILFISNYDQALTAGHDSVLCHVDDYCLRRLHQLELHTLCLTYSALIDQEQSLMVDLRDYHLLRGERESIRVRDQRYEDKEAELSILRQGPKYTAACSEEWKDLDPEKAFQLLEDKVSSCIVHQSICKSVIDVKFEKFRASQEQCTTLLLDNQRRLAKRKMKGMKYVSSYKECKAERRKERQRERERKMCTVKTFLPWFKADSNRAVDQLNLRPLIRDPFYNPRRFFRHADSQNERRELILKRLRAAYHIKHMQHCQVSDNTARDLALSVETEDRGDRERASDIKDKSKTTVKEKGLKVECCEGAHLLQEEGGGTSKQSEAKLYSGHGCMDKRGICQRQTELISLEPMPMGIGIGRRDQELDNDDVNKTSKEKSADSGFNIASHEGENERENQRRKRRNKTKDQEDATGRKAQDQGYQRASDCMETQRQQKETANSCTETSTKIESNAQAKLKQDAQTWQGKDKHHHQCNTKEGPQEEIKTNERDTIERERENSIPDSQTQEQRGQGEKINGGGETPNRRPNRENWFDHRDDESQGHQRWGETRGMPFRPKGRWMGTNNAWDRDIAREGYWRKERRYNKKDTEVRAQQELVTGSGETMDGEVRKDELRKGEVRKGEDTMERRPRRQTHQSRRQRQKKKRKEPHPSDSSIDWRNREDKCPDKNEESIMDRKKGTWAASNMACESDNLCDPAVLVSTTNPEPHIRNRRLSPGSGNCGGGGGGGCTLAVDQQPRQTSPGATEGSLNGPTHAHTFRRDRERRTQQHKGRGPRREGLRGAGRVADRPPKQSSKERWVENSLSLLRPPPAFPVQDSPAKLQPAVSYASKVKAGAAGGALEDDRPAIGVLLQNQWGLSFISEVLQASEGSGCAPGPTELSQPSDDSEPAEETLLTIQYGSDMLVPATNMITIGQCPDEEEGNGKLLLSCRHLVEALKYHNQEWNTICNKRKQDQKKVVWFKNSLEHPA